MADEGHLPIESASDILHDTPVDLPRMAPALGVELVQVGSLPEHVSGQIERLNFGYRIAFDASDGPRRRRCPLAHELGHFLLHRDLIEDRIWREGVGSFAEMGPWSDVSHNVAEIRMRGLRLG